MKLLVMSVSAGSGHTRAAEAICAYAAQSPHNIVATHIDAMDYVSRSLRKVYTDFYIKLISNAPKLWGALYDYSNDAKPNGRVERLRRALEQMNARALRKKIADFNPDAIVCTHFLPAEMLARLLQQGDLKCPVWVQVTDFDLHRMWLHEGMAGYFAANDEVAFRMRSLGIAADRVHVTGIPIMPAFAQKPERAAAAAELGIDPLKPTILLMGGGAGVGDLAQVAQRLLTIAGDFQLIALAGKNAQALATLQRLAARVEHAQRLFPQGFTRHIERLMACADVLITKPGGLTTSEGLAMGLPMIVNAAIPGQEERNADYLMEQGVAWHAFDNLALEFRVRQLLAQPDQLAAMQARAQATGRALAGQSVLEHIMNHFAQ